MIVEFFISRSAYCYGLIGSVGIKFSETVIGVLKLCKFWFQNLSSVHC